MLPPDNFWKKHRSISSFVSTSIEGFENKTYERKISSLADFFSKKRLRLEKRTHKEIIGEVVSGLPKNDPLGREILAMGTEVKWNGGDYRADICMLYGSFVENCEVQRTTCYNPKTGRHGGSKASLLTKTKNYCVGFSDEVLFPEKDFESILGETNKEPVSWRSPAYEESLESYRYPLEDMHSVSSVMIPFGEGRTRQNQTHRLLAELSDVKLRGKSLCEYYGIIYLATPPYFFAVVNGEEFPELAKLL